MPTRAGIDSGSGGSARHGNRQARSANGRGKKISGFFITLCSSMSPFRKGDIPDLPEFRQRRLYNSHNVEDGRDRYRLHLGRFNTSADAQIALSGLRSRFPTAWIVKASSLAEMATRSKAVAEPNKMNGRRDPNRAPKVTPELGNKWATTGSSSTIFESQTGSYYAVHLRWSRRPFDRHAIPDLPLLNSHKLYSVEANQEGKHWYGLRLGFFPSKGPAEKVARSLKHEFGQPKVEEVTSTEHALAVSAFDPMSTTISLRRPEGLPKPGDPDGPDGQRMSIKEASGVHLATPRQVTASVSKHFAPAAGPATRNGTPKASSKRYNLWALKHSEGVTKLPLSEKGQSVARRLFEKLRSNVLRRSG